MRSVYVTATGQVDNLGDSLLRRGYLEVLRSSGRLHVNLSGSTPDYITGLDLRSDDRSYDSTREWESSLLRSALLGKKPLLALNAGEARITPNHTYLGRRVAALARVVTLFGGQFIQSGLGVREAPAVEPTPTLLRALSRASVVTWRDQESASGVAVGTVQPDWAFALSPLAGPEVRDVITISMRGDRPPPSLHWVRVVNEIASANGMKIVLAAQVRRDNDRLHEIAEQLGGSPEVVEWSNDEDHASRLHFMAHLYSRSRAVVSDRLHALILGALHGAVPLGLTTASAEKLRRTLAPAGLQSWVFDSAELEGAGGIELPASADISARADEARIAVRRVGDLIAGTSARVRGSSGI